MRRGRERRRPYEEDGVDIVQRGVERLRHGEIAVHDLGAGRQLRG